MNIEDYYNGIRWLLKLDKSQVKAVKGIIKETQDLSFWDGVNKYNIRGIIGTLADRVYKAREGLNTA